MNNQNVITFEIVYQQLVKAVPTAISILQELRDKKVLQSPTPESFNSVGRNLLRILTTPRATGIEALSVFFAVLERIHNPYSNTQRINVPLENGKEAINTCVVASRIFYLLSKRVDLFARWAQEVTTPNLCFLVVCHYPNKQSFDERVTWLKTFCNFRVLSDQTLLIYMSPDKNALSRALLEQTNLCHQVSQFEQKTENTRNIIDVLLQSSMMNYAMEGKYDSNLDINSKTHERGLSERSKGYIALDYDLFNSHIHPTNDLYNLLEQEKFLLEREEFLYRIFSKDKHTMKLQNYHTITELLPYHILIADITYYEILSNSSVIMRSVILWNTLHQLTQRGIEKSDIKAFLKRLAEKLQSSSSSLNRPKLPPTIHFGGQSPSETTSLIKEAYQATSNTESKISVDSLPITNVSEELKAVLEQIEIAQRIFG